MKGVFTILEGAGKGTSKPLTSAVMIVGRSKNADLQVDDPLVSRRHLEIRVEADGVFVENQSTQGTSLNGKPLVGVVSLNPGDVIEIGSTKFRFEEAPEAPPAKAGKSADPMESEIDGTRIADPAVLARPRKEDAEPDATRAVVEDGTRMLNAAELPNWVAQEKIENPSASKGPLFAFFALLVLLVLGGGCWFMFMRGGSLGSADGTIQYKDALYSFSLEYPLDWSKVADEAGVVGYGQGRDGDKEWCRLNIYTDKDAQHEVTGLTDGFLRYQETLKKRFPGFELSASKVAKVRNATVMIFWFNNAKLEGKGIYTLNGDARIVLTCVSPKSCIQQYDSIYTAILRSFRLGEFEPQLVIDFPEPDAGMQQLALASPSGLARQVDEHTKRAESFLRSRDVKPDNLFSSMQEYSKALQLAIAGPQRLPAYNAAAKGLAQATRLFNQALERQRFEINSSLNQGDLTQAYWAANKMMQMVPDKLNPAYQEASKIIKSLPKPKE